MAKQAARTDPSADRRGAILRAALECFVRDGYAEASIAEIRRLSGASVGSIYHHFGSKEGLAAAVYLEGIADYQAGMVAAITTETEARRGIYAAVRQHMRWVEQKPDWAGYLAHARHLGFMAHVEAEFTELNKRFMDSVGRWVLGQIERGELRRLPGDVFGALLLGPCQEHVRRWLEGSAQTAPTEAAEILAWAAWQSLRSRPYPHEGGGTGP